MNQLIQSSTDFRSVRDGRNSPDFYFDVDLSTARSIAAGTALIVNVAGNSFYCDANPGDGNAVVKFQDTNLDRVSTPFYVSPGFIAKIPFTQMLIENVAQPGKKIRIAYGVDVEFFPGSVSQIALTGASTDDYIAKSANGQNWLMYKTSSIGAGLSGTIGLRNNSSQTYRVNSVTAEIFGATSLLNGLFLNKYYTITQAPNTQSVNTKANTTITNGLDLSVDPTATATVEFARTIVGNQVLQFVQKSPIYVNAGDGLGVRLFNGLGTSLLFSVAINYDIL